MLKRMLMGGYLLPLLFLAGVSQYSLVAYSAVVSGNVALWTIDSSELMTAGPLRYAKDVAIVFLSIAWVFALPSLHLPKELARLIRIYIMWLGSVISVGLMGFILEYSPIFFLPAGLRWLLLLHAAFGVFILSSTFVVGNTRHKLIFRILLAIFLINCYVTLLQFRSTSSTLGLAYGASRLTGLFSNAGVAGNYALAVALLVSLLNEIGQKKRMIVSFFCLLLALASGTRYATGAVFILLLGQLWEVTDKSGKGSRIGKKIVFVPLSIVAIFIGYQALISQVDRGDAISQQFETGGRAANFLVAISSLASADIGELVFGRGLGIGTNTAIGVLLGQGIDPEQYRFNKLVDNSFITGMFQFGLLGSLVFWFGIWRFISFCKPKYSRQARTRFYMTTAIIFIAVVLGNPFEQYFLMIAFAAALGTIYWTNRIAFQKFQMGQK